MADDGLDDSLSDGEENLHGLGGSESGSSDFGDFEDSMPEEKNPKKDGIDLKNQHYDAQFDLSQSQVDVPEAKDNGKERREMELKNQPYDEALDLSTSQASMDVDMATGMPKNAAARSKGGDHDELQNQPYDEAHDLSDADSMEESMDSNVSPKTKNNMASRGDTPPRGGGGFDKFDKDDDVDEIPGDKTKPSFKSAPQSKETDLDDDSDEDGSEESSEDDAEDSTGAGTLGTNAPVKMPEGAYNADDYKHLKVDTEVKDLFQYIGRYKPHNIELDTKLKCFVPDYIPSVGEIDAFLKIPRPDGDDDNLGLKLLDEPAATQSDPTVLDLQMRASAKKSNLEPVNVHSIENADKNPREITKWIENIRDLHRTKPPPTVQYKKSMPDIESLMQVWPEEFEELLGKVKLPEPSMDLSLEEYVRVICSMLDIPVYSNMVESLHVLFTLYSEFKNNQHFTSASGNRSGGMMEGEAAYQAQGQHPSEQGYGMMGAEAKGDLSTTKGWENFFTSEGEKPLD
jgi:intraflagellar transport protein 46